MPEISRFPGIVVAMYYNDHAPPHFHVRYGDREARISIESLEILDGRIPKRVSKSVRDWAELNEAGLEKNWGLAEETNL